ncbi:hypothetical protein Asi02nite_65690 [Asanoa siamensis]|uniref:Uncharacterized protein n=1 Tax=Asanoa siamensis TaxID=926357 RepID=A0ABQ4D0J5_9ACTN|nr:hypothetical protein Asi02nite_65690 [Asanoa siamensis]
MLGWVRDFRAREVTWTRRIETHGELPEPAPDKFVLAWQRLEGPDGWRATWSARRVTTPLGLPTWNG